MAGGITIERAENAYKNYMDLRDDTFDELTNKKNPETKMKYTRLEMLDEVNQNWSNWSFNQKYRNKKPVSFKEGLSLFKTYYSKKYPKDIAQRKMKADISRRKKSVLQPDSKNSYLYRPKINVKTGEFVGKTGPELYDLEGIDSGVMPEEFKEENLFDKSKSLIKKSKISKKSRKSRKSRKIRKSSKSNKSHRKS